VRYHRYRPMDQASRIIAQWTRVSDVISHERIACGAWKKAVGRKIALRTRALKLVRNTLVVEVEDETWRKNLWSLRYQILRNLEKALGPEIVTAVELRVMPPRFGPQREQGAALEVSLDDAESIVDPGLRRIYKAARQRETA
jgi:predicted nucleic acid-binding Zn ribbon protein